MQAEKQIALLTANILVGQRSCAAALIFYGQETGEKPSLSTSLEGRSRCIEGRI